MTGTEAATAAPLTVPQLLDGFATLGDHPLFVTPTGRLTFAAADDRSALLARRLLAAGVGKNTRVAILLGNSPDWVVTFLALARIGAHAVLCNPFAKGPELAHVLRHADVAAVVTGAEAGEGVQGLLEAAVPALVGHGAGAALRTPTHPYLRTVWWIGADRPGWADDPDGLDPVAVDLLHAVEGEVAAADAVATAYTSVTTAEPKAVVHCQGAFLRQARKLAVRRGFTATDVVYTPMPLFWIGGVCIALLSCAATGIPMVTDARFDAGRALDLMESEGVTAVYCFPQAAESMVAHPTFAARDLHRLRIGPALIRGPEFAGVTVDMREQSLGMTETCGPHTMAFDADARLPEHLRGSFAFPMDGMEHRIVDRDSGAVLTGEGEIGELWIRGDCLMLGFHKRERSETFEPDGWYRTGDLCSFREGRLFFHGRGGDMIKTAGFNVAPAEVERVIGALDDVIYVTVLGLPDPVRDQVIGTVVAVRPGSTLDADALRAVCGDHLSSYKVPSVWCVVDEAGYPMGDTGKVDRTRALALLEAART